ncbi:hypothetical protein GCM10022223_46160 [Kineosporia mesophila]|uniref:Uncharacterized protein n=1 Tax=Kineosporia mesophila TaxID=566012 RepID=A0ABP7A2X4_9ACTN
MRPAAGPGGQTDVRRLQGLPATAQEVGQSITIHVVHHQPRSAGLPEISQGSLIPLWPIPMKDVRETPVPRGPEAVGDRRDPC